MATYIAQIFYPDGRDTFEEITVSDDMLAFMRSGKVPDTKPPVVVTPDPPVVVVPPTSKPLTFLPPTWDGKQIFFHFEGGDGTPVKFRAIGVTNLTSGPIAQPQPYPADYKGPSKFYMEQSGNVLGPFDVDMFALTHPGTTPVVTTKPTTPTGGGIPTGGQIASTDDLSQETDFQTYTA